MKCLYCCTIKQSIITSMNKHLLGRNVRRILKPYLGRKWMINARNKNLPLLKKLFRFRQEFCVYIKVSVQRFTFRWIIVWPIASLVACSHRYVRSYVIIRCPAVLQLLGGIKGRRPTRRWLPLSLPLSRLVVSINFVRQYISSIVYFVHI